MPPTPIVSPKSAPELLNMYYLDVRCAILETAAALDRMDRAPDAPKTLSDKRRENLKKALSVCLSDDADNRVERILVLLSEK